VFSAAQLDLQPAVDSNNGRKFVSLIIASYR
jgi:hypothetical protein